MTKLIFNTLVTTIVVLMPVFVSALEVDREVDPRITVGGRVVTSLDAVDLDTDPDAEGEINVSDSSLLTRFDKQLYGNGIGGAVVGINESEQGAIFHQLHVFYRDQKYRALLGRTRLPNTVIEFPLVRDDDLIEYTHVSNGSSEDEFDQLYGKLFSVGTFIDEKIQALDVWTGSRNNGDDPLFASSQDGLDSYGVSWSYDQPEDLVYVSRIRKAGIKIDRQKVRAAGDNEWITAVIGGVDLNLNMNPVSNWSLALQLIANNGSDESTTLDFVSGRAKNKSYSYVTSLRYVHRPLLLTRWQAALTLAYKDYTDFSDGTQWSIAPNFNYRIGQGVEVFSQLVFTDYGNALGGGEDTLFQVGISFELESVFNDSIGERDSILNLEHSNIN